MANGSQNDKDEEEDENKGWTFEEAERFRAAEAAREREQQIGRMVNELRRSGFWTEQQARQAESALSTLPEIPGWLRGLTEYARNFDMSGRTAYLSPTGAGQQYFRDVAAAQPGLVPFLSGMTALQVLPNVFAQVPAGTDIEGRPAIGLPAAFQGLPLNLSSLSWMWGGQTPRAIWADVPLIRTVSSGGAIPESMREDFYRSLLLRRLLADLAGV